MTAPIVTSWSQELYDQLVSFTPGDATNGWALLRLVNAMCDPMFQELDDLARDTVDGYPGWSVLLDLNRAPTKALPWLAQFVGVQLLGTLSDAEMRTTIATKGGVRRGTLGSIIAAAQQYLTGAQTVIVRERYDASNPNADSPYNIQVTTYTSQSGDAGNQALMQAAVLAQKPVGDVMSFRVVAGQDWQSVVNNNATWTTLLANFTTWQGVVDAIPGA